MANLVAELIVMKCKILVGLVVIGNVELETEFVDKEIMEMLENVTF